jgi:hypothetical protein
MDGTPRIGMEPQKSFLLDLAPRRAKEPYILLIAYFHVYVVFPNADRAVDKTGCLSLIDVCWRFGQLKSKLGCWIQKPFVCNKKRTCSGNKIQSSYFCLSRGHVHSCLCLGETFLQCNNRTINIITVGVSNADTHVAKANVLGSNLLV